ncbi:MAG TPA: non-homologous end-joining DNA ligase [Symbiobacteriaceae bacterium]|jgi:DNA ligase D-like protein (predicted ligase)
MELPFEPMLLERAPRPFADGRWLYQVKWDGVRNLALVEDGRVRHWSRRLRDRTALYPELAGGLAAALGPGRTVLDGEIVVLKDGKPSFGAVLERDVAARPPDQRKLQALPAVFMVFDLLEHGGEELYRRPMEERLERLRSALAPADHWQVIASFPGDSGPDLFKATGEASMEGVVAKRLGSGYAPGTRSQDWLKIKHRRRMLAVICGYTVPVGRPGGLLLGAYRGDRLRYIGRVGSGITGETLALLKANLPTGPCPFHREPNLQDRFAGPPGPVVWTRPVLTVQVEYSEWTEAEKLRDPVLVGFSTEPPESAQGP